MNPTRKSTRITGILWLIGSAVLFGSYGIWSKLISSSFGEFFQAWTRAAIVLTIIVPLIIGYKKIRKISYFDIKWFSIVGISGALMVAPFFYAINTIGIAASSLFHYASALLAMHFIGLVFFGEKPTTRQSISDLLAVIGLVLVFSTSLSDLSIIGMALASVGGLSAGVSLAIAKKISDRYPVLMIMAAVWICVIIVNLPLSLLVGERQIPLALDEPWLYQFLYAVIALTAVSMAMIGLRQVDAGIGGLVRTLQVVFGVLFGILLFEEVATVSIAAGSLLIISAVALPHTYFRGEYRGQV